MKQPTITDRTKEKPIPDHVRGLHWEIDHKHRLAFNSYGSIDWYSTERSGVLGRISLSDARNYAVALTAALAALDGEPTPSSVKVVNWELERRIEVAKQTVAKANEAIAALRETLDRAEKAKRGEEPDP